MARYLIVANQTLSGELLMERIHKLLAEGPCSFHVVVPATHTRDQAFYTEGASHAVAERRLEAALERFRAAGAQVDGEVGDASPMLAGRGCVLFRGHGGGVPSAPPSRAFPLAQPGPPPPPGAPL